MRLNESSKHSFYTSLMENLEPEDEGKYYYKRFSGAGEIDYLEFDDEWEAHNYAEKVNKETGDETAVYDMNTGECLELFDAKEGLEESYEDDAKYRINYEDDLIIIRKNGEVIDKGIYDYLKDNWNDFDDFHFDSKQKKYVYEYNGDTYTVEKVVVESSLKESYAIVDYYDADGYEQEKIVNGKSPKDVETKVKRIADKYEVIDIHQASADVADSKYLNSLGRGVERKDYNNSTFEESDKLNEANYDPYSQPQEVIDEINSKNFFIADSFDEVLSDYENNPDSDWYIDVIKQAQQNIERRKAKEQEKAEKKAVADEEKEYKLAKSELNKLRKEHSTRIGRIEYLFNLVKDYESKHGITEGAHYLKESVGGIIEWIWGKDASPDNLSPEELDVIKKLDDRLGYFEDMYYAGHTSKEGCFDLIKDEVKDSKYGLSSEEQEKLLKLYSRYNTDSDKELVDLMKKFWDEHEGSGASGVETQKWFKDKGYDLTQSQIDDLWNKAAEGYDNEEDDVLTIKGIRFEDKSDAKAWLHEKIAEYGNTYFFPDEEKYILNKLIEKFGNTYFWH